MSQSVPISFTGIWEQFSVRDGLPDMKIESLLVDSRGTLWIGTRAKGVALYDGDQFHCYTVRDGLAGNGVFAIQEAPDGTVWLATSGGLSYWDGTGFWVLDESRGLSFLWGAGTDPEGTLWFGVEREASRPPRVCRVENRRLRVLALDKDTGEMGRSIHAIGVQDDGCVWCGGHGLYRLVDGRAERVNPKHAGLAEIECLCVAGDEVVVATIEGTFRLRGEHLDPIPGVGRRAVGLKPEDSEGGAWISMRDGALARMSEAGVNDIASAGVPLWRAIAPDATGRLWLGSYGFGLLCYDETRVRTATVGGEPATGSAAAVARGAERMWIGTATGVVGSDGTCLRNWVSNEVERPIGEATALLVDGRDRLWIGRRNGMVLLREDEQVGRCDKVEALIPHRIDRLVEGREGEVWAATFLAGRLVRYDASGAGQSVSVGPEGLYSAHVGALAAGPDGRLYLGSRTPQVWPGVVAFDGRTAETIEGLGEAPVTALCFDRGGRLWVGTTEGVSVVDGDYVLSYSAEDGLTSEIVTALMCCSRGRVWIGTEGGGVCVFDGDILQSLSLKERPYFNTVNDISEGPGGQVWFATNGGALCWTPKEGFVDVRVTELVADERYPAPTEVQFPDTIGRLTITFRGTSELERCEHLVYRYRLVGFAEDWKQTAQRTVDFRGLPPGSYEFEVQAVDRDLNYSDLESVRMTVVADPRIAALNQALRSESVQGEFVSESQAMKEVLQQVTEVAWTDLTVLILGETGTGKGLAARQIHDLSERRDGPCIHVNCGALQEGLVDSELFGHEKGAFTSAVGRRLGKFELAQGGTIFLDEIGDLPLESQTRLLKVLQDKTIERVGGTESIAMDVRVIAATNRDLARAVREETYRADLYYRLNVFPIRIPPLRERREDIPPLAAHFVASFAAHLNRSAPRLDAEASQALMAYDWPGNVRELEHVLQRAVILARDRIVTRTHLSLTAPVDVPSPPSSPTDIIPLKEHERRYLERVLAHTGGVIHGKEGAAELLDIKPTTLRSRLERLGVEGWKRRGRGAKSYEKS